MHPFWQLVGVEILEAIIDIYGAVDGRERVTLQ
jgi:hypothetical protein